MKVARPIFCEYCGNDKPWARKDWFLDFSRYFCCGWCALDYQILQWRLARKAKRKTV